MSQFVNKIVVTRERAFSGIGKSYGRVFAAIERVGTTLAWKRTIRR